jgi:DNA mismatch repair protein MutL
VNRIHVLPLQVANQIAAGEVIERPASVVKELLENSIDAGASLIDIELKKGGLELIRVRDNGSGILKEDLLLAIAPHATSKINQIDDLMTLHSLGFRGEALASISATCDFSLASKESSSESAWKLNFKGDEKISDVEPTAHPQGTTISVENLFYTLPARRRFLKSARTEFQHIEALIKSIALSRYKVGFVLHHDDKQVLNLKPIVDKEHYIVRVGKILGKSFAEHAIVVDQESIGLRLWGWVLPLDQSRAHADQQYFFVNGRVVKDRLIYHAMRSAFQSILDQARYPGYVLYLECDPAIVDVNVHPTKHEVRFEEPRLVHDFIQYAVQKIYSMKPEPLQSNPTTQFTFSTMVSEPVKPYQVPRKSSTIKILTIFEDRFLLFEEDNDLLLVDYVVAQKIVNEVDIKNALKEGDLKAQPLLMPESLQYTETEVEVLLKHQEALLQFGVAMRQVSPERIMIRTLPFWLKSCKVKNFMDDVLAKKDLLNTVIEHSMDLKKDFDAAKNCYERLLLLHPKAALSKMHVLKLLSPKDFESLL